MTRVPTSNLGGPAGGLIQRIENTLMRSFETFSIPLSLSKCTMGSVAKKSFLCMTT